MAEGGGLGSPSLRVMATHENARPLAGFLSESDFRKE